MILEVEKDAAPGADQFADHGWALGSIELHADFVGEGRVTDGRHDLPGGLGRRYIQGNDETLARVHMIFGLSLPSVSVLVRAWLRVAACATVGGRFVG